MKSIRDLYADTGMSYDPATAGCPIELGKKQRVSIVALGDVGATMLIGLRLLGAPVIQDIGIFDISGKNTARLEMEINQIYGPGDWCQDMPPVEVIGEDEIFQRDVVLFCASRGVPPVKSEEKESQERPGAGEGPEKPAVDVRMVQLEANREIIGHYGELARKAGFRGLFCVISDPVDPLCAAFLDSSGLEPCQIKGFGLGVMNARARYYSQRDARFSRFLTDGRVFGPHGDGLVVADSVRDYDDDLSLELTGLTRDANIKVRDLGFKPYIAPALSSGALSVISLLRGEWHYSSLFLGGAYLGIRNRMTAEGDQFEDVPLDDRLYSRILKSYQELVEIRKNMN